MTNRKTPDVDPEVPPLDDRTLERLLAGRDAPSVTEKEELFERIHARVQSEAGARRWLVPALGAALSAAAAAVFAFLLPSAAPEFQARGGSVDAPVELQLSCGREACRPGAKLSFSVRSAAGGYFAAFARRGDGVIIWYFPDELGTTPAVPASETSAVLARAIVLGPEHAAGSYEVFGVFTARALTQGELEQALGDDLRGKGDMRVVRQNLEVAP